jgi:hypothetical protein
LPEKAMKVRHFHQASAHKMIFIAQASDGLAHKIVGKKENKKENDTLRLEAMHLN